MSSISLKGSREPDGCFGGSWFFVWVDPIGAGNSPLISNGERFHITYGVNNVFQHAWRVDGRELVTESAL